MSTEPAIYQISNQPQKPTRKLGRPPVGQSAREHRWYAIVSNEEHETLQRLANRYCGGNLSAAIRRAVAIYDQFDQMMSDDQFDQFSKLLDLYSPETAKTFETTEPQS